MLQQLQQTAAQLQLPFGHRVNTYNSRLAQELEKWTESVGKADQFRHAVFHAYFASGQNIARSEILVDIVESIGLSGVEARQVLETRRFRNAVDRDWARSKKMGVTAVPTFVLGSDIVVGAQPKAVLEQLLIKHGIARR